MDGMIKFNGIVGVLIFLVTVVVLVLAVLINLVIYFYGTYSGQPKSKWAKNWLQATLILLVFDGIFFVLIFLQDNRVWKQDEAEAFDYRMLTIWIPFHIIGYFLLGGLLHFTALRKEKINKFIDK